MLVQNPVVEKPITELSTKLQQLRRLKGQSAGPPASWHLNSALQAAKNEPAGIKSEVSYIFIGIEIPTSPSTN